MADAQRAFAEAEGTPQRLVAEQQLRDAQAGKAATEARVAQASERSTISEAAGKADKAVAEAQTAQATAANAAERATADAARAIADAQKAVADARVAQATATNAPEKAAADAKRATAEAEKARIETQFKEQEIKLGFRKTEQEIIIAKENARIAALNAAQAKETNVLRRQELKQKIDEATDKKSQATRDQKSLLDSQVGDIEHTV